MKTRVALEAPKTARYRNFFARMKAGDFVLHYLTASLTPSKESQSTIVAVSKVVSEPEVLEKKIVAVCKNTKVLLKPISLSKLQEVREKSREFDMLLRMGMQRYLTRISQTDFVSIIKAYPENRAKVSSFLNTSEVGS